MITSLVSLILWAWLLLVGSTAFASLVFVSYISFKDIMDEDNV